MHLKPADDIRGNAHIEYDKATEIETDEIETDEDEKSEDENMQTAMQERGQG